MKVIVRSAVLALAMMCGAGLASAEPVQNKRADAKVLFDEGRELFAAGDVTKACEKFASSYALDRKAPTLLNLAICHEREGKLVLALSEFTEAQALSRSGPQQRMQQLADARANELGAKIPRIRIVFAQRPSGVLVSVDGAAIDNEALDGKIPVDPGAHELVVSAQGRKPWQSHVDATIGQTSAVYVPVLEYVSEEPGVRPQGGAHPGESTSPSGTPSTPSPERPTGAPATSSTPEGGSDTRRTLAVVALGAGAVSLGVGGFFGFRALGQRGDAEDACAAGRCDQGRSINEDGQTSATIANVTVGAAVILGAVGAYLLLTSSPTATTSTTSTTKVRVGASGIRF
jgi:hypothetical protein